MRGEPDADLSSERGEYLSLAGILGTTLAVFVLAVADPLFFLGVLPAFAAPVFGFRFAYGRACRRSGAPSTTFSTPSKGQAQGRGVPGPSDRPPGLIQVLKPSPDSSPNKGKKESPR